MQCTATGASRPGCGAWSAQVHGSYLRYPTNVPSAGRSVVLQLRVRRFACRTAECSRRTFVEQIPGLTRRHGQRTERLRSTLAAIGLALAGRAGPAWPASSVRRSAAAPSCSWSTHFPSRKCQPLGWLASTSTRPARAATTGPFSPRHRCRGP
ncbi:transposase family protein [Streptomyces sp. NPDC005262]|uniref:transposase family protein n=1 Tax=Streptomyces sp. NPDC005262 TaxID=3364710 RepID=UPI0036A29994